MLTLAAADTLAGGASVATQVTCTLMGMELSAGPTETYKVLDQRQLASSPATIYTVPGSTTTFVKSIMLVNNDTTARTAQLFRGGTAAANAITPVTSIPAGGMWVYEDGQGWQTYDSNGVLFVSTSSTIGQMWTSKLASDHAISSVTGTKVMGVPSLGVGTYTFEVWAIVQTGTTTVGPMLGVNFTGTSTLYGMHFRFADATTAVTAEVHSMDDVGNLGFGFISGMAHNAYSTTSPNMGTTVGASGTGVNLLCFIEGLINVTAVGELELWHSSETATSTTVKTGTSMVVTRTA